MRRAAVLCAFLLTAATASAQSYNPHAGDSVAPNPGTVAVPSTPNGVDWLNSMLGLSPSFLGKDGKVSSTYIDVSSDLEAYVTKSSLTSTLLSYLPLTGGNTTGPLNGYQFISLKGSSASGATTTLSTDGSNAVSEDTCLVVPLKGVTEFDINAAGVSSNGTDAVMNRFSGTAAYRSDGVLQINNSTASNNYPGFGSPGTWSIALSSDSSSGCLVVKATAGGTGSWSWRANIHYENLVP